MHWFRSLHHCGPDCSKSHDTHTCLGNWVTPQTALTLSEEAERSRPFASALGQLMMTQRATEAAAKQVCAISSYEMLCMLDVSCLHTPVVYKHCNRVH